MSNIFLILNFVSKYKEINTLWSEDKLCWWLLDCFHGLKTVDLLIYHKYENCFVSKHDFEGRMLVYFAFECLFLIRFIIFASRFIVVAAKYSLTTLNFLYIFIPVAKNQIVFAFIIWSLQMMTIKTTY